MDTDMNQEIDESTDPFLDDESLQSETTPTEDAIVVPDPDDRYLRLLAEFDNFRRRSYREREQATQIGIERLAVPLFDVLDNLERALAHALATAPGPWVDGVSLTVRQFSEALRAAGIEAIDPLGEPFDSRWHEALGHAESATMPADHVVTVVAPGYRLGDRLLRPARVLISSGENLPPA